ncbi:hypothetical protein H5410_046109 [Solanum commersonii]|uniref:Uncharacterized protein n=1 Tax=Solanum commersonii TaxID=4109 RepID=A0A9J5XBC6_SOLCO|nr:hypothetical protein H5410_046109 [Solanum commersonii]
MNAHNKTHFTHAKINCALKDSSCESPLSKNLFFTILALNTTSKSNATLTLTRMNTIHNFTHRFARIFQSTFVSTHSISKRSF